MTMHRSTSGGRWMMALAASLLVLAVAVTF
jgi:hypothetical protein